MANDAWEKMAADLSDQLTVLTSTYPSRLVAIVCLVRAAKIHEAFQSVGLMTADEVKRIWAESLAHALKVRDPSAPKPAIASSSGHNGSGKPN